MMIALWLVERREKRVLVTVCLSTAPKNERIVCSTSRDPEPHRLLLLGLASIHAHIPVSGCSKEEGLNYPIASMNGVNFDM